MLKRKIAKGRLLNMLIERKTLHFRETVMSILYKAIRVKRFDSGCSQPAFENVPRGTFFYAGLILTWI